MDNLLNFTFIIAISLALTELIRRYSLKNNFLDRPNERSSHTVPTPRGGGLSIVVIFLIAISFVDSLPTDIFMVLMGSGVVIAIIGFWDDHDHVPAKWRLLAHFVASFWVLYWLGGIPEFQFLDFSLDPGWFGIGVVAFVLVWLLNLFNFMDGIDGIAASEAIFVSSAGAFFCWLMGADNISIILLILSASTAGFLALNWPPAKIFMGDVGSSFLGLIIGVIAYASILEGASVWIWLILLAVFLVDSGVTLLRRILNGEKWHEAHCSHAYQHAAKKWGHKKVTISVILINILWLFPLALLAYSVPDFAFVLTLLTITPLVVVALKLKASITYK